MKKAKLRIKAVRDNDVEALARLSDASKWYKYVQPKTGNTLLHIAVLTEKKDIFDYLLAIADVPLNHKNKRGDTVLNFCCPWWCPGGRFDDYFAYELIKRGISVDCIPLENGDTFLHVAVRKNYVKVSKLLMHMGYDLNALNTSEESPMWTCLQNAKYARPAKPETIEILTALLCHGADLTNFSGYNAFEFVIQYCSDDLHELFFNYVIDDYTPIHFEIILILAYERSALFRDTVERTKNVIVERDALQSYNLHLFKMNADYLNLLIKRYPGAIREAFAVALYLCDTGPCCEKKFMENATILFESDLRDDTIEFLRRFQLDMFVPTQIIKDNSVAHSHMCFLLSYGLQMHEDDLVMLYRRYRYGEMIKILLHMEMEKAEPRSWPPFLALLYNVVNCDFEHVLENIEDEDLHDVSHLLPYFAHAKLRARCAGSERTEIVAVIENQPDVPLLSELARNVVRKYLINTFNIRKASQFYTLVNALPIASEHKKIITLEKKLY